MWELRSGEARSLREAHCEEDGDWWKTEKLNGGGRVGGDEGWVLYLVGGRAILLQFTINKNKLFEIIANFNL